MKIDRIKERYCHGSGYNILIFLIDNFIKFILSYVEELKYVGLMRNMFFCPFINQLDIDVPIEKPACKYASGRL